MKIRMHVHKFVMILCLLSFPLFSFSLVAIAPNADYANTIEVFADDSDEFYDTNQSVTYKLETSFTLTSKESGLNIPFSIQSVKLNDRQPDNNLTRYTPNYQEIKSNKTTFSGASYSDLNQSYYDCFNNSYDTLDLSLNNGDTFTIEYEYEVKLNEIYFKDIKDEDIGSYPPAGDPIYDFYNTTEIFYEANETELINLSNSLVESDDNPIEKAEKIYDWIIENIDYEVQSEEIGALKAYQDGKGDCSDFSDLMITLLRIQSIPARKVTGFLVSADPTIRPEKGNEFEFDVSYDTISDTFTSDNQFLGHAWLEYYVPNIGWVVTDPTWGLDTNFDYFNRIDFLRFNYNIGAYMEVYGTSPTQTISEFPFYPAVVCGSNIDYGIEYTAKVTVLETNLVPAEEVNLWEFIIMVIIISAIIAGMVGIALGLYRHEKKKNQRKLEEQQYTQEEWQE